MNLEPEPIVLEPGPWTWAQPRGRRVVLKMDTLSNEALTAISRHWPIDQDPLAALAQRCALHWRRRKRLCILDSIRTVSGWLDQQEAAGAQIHPDTIRLALLDIHDIV